MNSEMCEGIDNEAAETIRTPHNIQFLLHCHCYREPFEAQFSGATEDAIALFCEHGLIKPNGADSRGQSYKTTEKGAFLVQHLCDTPLPHERMEYYIPNR